MKIACLLQDDVRVRRLVHEVHGLLHGDRWRVQIVAQIVVDDQVCVQQLILRIAQSYDAHVAPLHMADPSPVQTFAPVWTRPAMLLDVRRVPSKRALHWRAAAPVSPENGTEALIGLTGRLAGRWACAGTLVMMSAAIKGMSRAGRHLGQAGADAELLHQRVRECGQAAVLGDVGAHESHLAGWLLRAITAATEELVIAQASPGPYPRGALRRRPCQEYVTMHMHLRHLFITILFLGASSQQDTAHPPRVS